MNPMPDTPITNATDVIEDSSALTDEDWELIFGLWEERERLMMARDTLKEALASVRRDLAGLTNSAIAEKFNVSVHTLQRLPANMRRGTVRHTTDSNGYR